MKGYVSEKAAYRAAKKAGNVGLTGSGQECCPLRLPDGSWGYWMAHNVFNRNFDAREIQVPGRKLISLREAGFEERIPLDFQWRRERP